MKKWLKNILRSFATISTSLVLLVAVIGILPALGILPIDTSPIIEFCYRISIENGLFINLLSSTTITYLTVPPAAWFVSYRFITGKRAQINAVNQRLLSDTFQKLIVSHDLSSEFWDDYNVNREMLIGQCNINPNKIFTKDNIILELKKYISQLDIFDEQTKRYLLKNLLIEDKHLNINNKEQETDCSMDKHDDNDLYYDDMIELNEKRQLKFKLLFILLFEWIILFIIFALNQLFFSQYGKIGIAIFFNIIAIVLSLPLLTNGIRNFRIFDKQNKIAFILLLFIFVLITINFILLFY